MKTVTLGEVLAEFFQKEKGKSFKRGNFLGPFGGGAPAIFADTISKLGTPSGFIGVVGKDDFGNFLIERLKKDGVEVSQVRKISRTTGTSFVTYSNGSRKFIFHMEHAAPSKLSSDLINPNFISEAELLHVSGSTLLISKSARRACYKAVRVAKKEGLRISFDPNVRTELQSQSRIKKIFRPLLRSSDLFLPSKREAKFLGGKELEKSINTFQKMGIKTIGIKKGKEGSLIIKGEERIEAPSFSVEEVDPTGAGDAWDAGFIYAILEGKSLRKSARFANAVGALSVRERGGMEGVKNKQKVEEFISKRA